MKAAPSELMKEYVQSQHFTSTGDIMAAMKEMFRDVVQTVMEVEMEEALGRERCQRAETTERPNYRNGYTKKGHFTGTGNQDQREDHAGGDSMVFQNPKSLKYREQFE